MIRISPLTILLPSILLVGCDWVDSTGVQDAPPPILLDDEGQVIRLQEGGTDTLDPGPSSDENGNVLTFLWDETPLQAGDLPGCATVEGFDSPFAATSVNAACVREDNCELYFEPQQVSDSSGVRTVFSVTTPELKAPVGATYQLRTISSDGTETQDNFTFCLVAENDPPVARDDLFPVVEGESLEITAAEVGRNLLSNDFDDIDVRNQELRVLTTPAQAPVLAVSFTLGTRGDFSYTPDPTIALAPGASRTDSFVYTITDGTNESSATVLITISASNEPPELIDEIPEIVAIAGIEQTVVFSEYFSDPEGGELGFTIAPGSLPTSGNFTVSNSGVLSGIADANDITSWPLTVVASDGNETTETEFTLTVVDNAAPTVRTIPAQSVDFGDSLSLGLATYFTDPENQNLAYSASSVDGATVTVNRNTGALSGTFSRAGLFSISVSADDGYNPPVTASVRITVAGTPNRSPIYSGSIENIQLSAGEVMPPVRGSFSDPDGDVLTYAIVGTLPVGISINRSTGVVSGSSVRTGSYTNLRIEATDPEGESVSSDTFSITISAVVPNRRPVYSGSISNQTVTLGSAITLISGNFSDPDGDSLSYSVVGVLPAGLNLAPVGSISGTPTRIGASANLRIRATDPDGLSIDSDVFRITVVPAPPEINQSPEYSGSISNQTVDRGDLLVPISGTFSDPDGDSLIYTVIGELPTGVTINRVTGVITGRPTRAGAFRNRRIQATDPEGLFVRSDVFSIFVEP